MNREAPEPLPPSKPKKRGRPPKGQPATPPAWDEAPQPPRVPWSRAKLEVRAERRKQAVRDVARFGTLRAAATAMGCREDEVPRFYGFRWAVDYALAIRRHIDLAYERLVMHADAGDTRAALAILRALDPERFAITISTKSEETKTLNLNERKQIELTIGQKSTHDLIEELRSIDPAMAELMADPVRLQETLRKDAPKLVGSGSTLDPERDEAPA